VTQDIDAGDSLVHHGMWKEDVTEEHRKLLQGKVGESLGKEFGGEPLITMYVDPNDAWHSQARGL
jgi:hypothetical protein